MRKKTLAALMAVLITIGMAGCGNNTSANQSSVTPETQPTESSSSVVGSESERYETDEYGRIYDKELGIYVYPSTESRNEEDVSTSEDGRAGARPGADEGMEVNPTTQNSDEISGLIIANISLGIQTPSTCEIMSFNPATGETKTISNFWFQDSSEYSYIFAISNGFFSGSYHFDESYTKIAADRTTMSNFETHAGWLTNDGEFFDITEAVGMASQSDFADAIQHRALGFTDNGLFVFCDGIGTDAKCYSVPVSNVSPSTVVEGFVAPHSAISMTYADCISLYDIVSDWIDDTHCILTVRNGNPTTSVIFDMEGKTKTEYIPSSSRKNWHGRLSPDGTQIAFTSVPLAGVEPPDIFIIPVDGGEPKRVVNHDFIITDTNIDFDFYSLSSGKSCCMLIDWR